MEINDIWNRIRHRDMGANLELSNEYGWIIYSHIRERLDSPEAVTRAYDAALKMFCDAASESTDGDPLSAMLCAYADIACIQESPGLSSVPPAPSAKKRQHPRRKRSKGHGFFRTLGFAVCFFVLLAGILAALWVVAGLLMDMGFLPEWDLGYQWFNIHVAPWF